MKRARRIRQGTPQQSQVLNPEGHRTAPTVYLDSSDFSLLSDPSRSTPELQALRRELLEFAETGQARFVFSIAHLSEMAPIAAESTAYATARADLLADLCGRNALISWDRLLREEALRLVDPSRPPVAALTADATWFPEVDGFAAFALEADGFRRTFETSLQELGVTHSQRRLLLQRFFRGNHPRHALRQGLERAAIFGELDSIVSKYPMRRSDANVIRRYVVGMATREAAEAAFLASLRDPRWMMRWFRENHATLSPIVELLRTPSRELATSVASILQPLNEAYLDLARVLGTEEASAVVKRRWIEQQGEIHRTVSASVAAKFLPATTPFAPSAATIERSPGLYTMLQCLLLLVQDALPPRSSRLGPSDVADAFHATYAPYVTLFRADRRMAPHVQRALGKHPTTVVASLEELPKHIRANLN